MGLHLATDVRNELESVGWALKDIPNLYQHWINLQVEIAKVPFESAFASARFKAESLRSLALTTDASVKESVAIALSLKLLGQGGTPVQGGSSILSQSGLIPPANWKMDASIAYGACKSLSQDFSGQKISSFELARKCTYGDGSKPSVANIFWNSASTSVQGPNQARLSTRITSYVQGGYRNPIFVLGIGAEDFKSKIEYQVNGDWTIPACANLAVCEPVLKIRADFNEVDAGRVVILVKSHALAGDVNLGSPGATVEVDRTRYPIRISTQVSRRKSHKGASHEPAEQVQQLTVVVSPTDLPSQVPPSAPTDLEQYFRLLDQWGASRSAQFEGPEAEDFSRSVARWIARAPVGASTDFGDFLSVLEWARLLLRPRSIQEFHLNPIELSYLKLAVEGLEKHLSDAVLPRIQGEGEKLGRDLDELRTEMLDSLLDQWADSEEISRDSWRAFVTLKNSSTLKSDSMAAAQLDSMMGSILDARDRRILLLSDLMEFRRNAREIQSRSMDSRAARLLWLENVK